MFSNTACSQVNHFALFQELESEIDKNSKTVTSMEEEIKELKSQLKEKNKVVKDLEKEVRY